MLVFLTGAPAIAEVALQFGGALVLERFRPSPFWLVGQELLSLLIWSSACVGWHRFVLLGERSKPRWRAMPFGQLEARFFLYLLMFSSFTLVRWPLLFWVGADAASTVVLLALVGACLFLFFPLIFPAVAVGEDPSLGQAWRTLRGSVLTLLLASLLALLPLICSFAALSLVYPAPGGAMARVAGAATSGLGLMAMIGIEVTLLSLAYAQLTGRSAALAPAGGAH